MTQNANTDVRSHKPAFYAARLVGVIFFYTFPLVLILLPPDVYGDGLVGAYFVLLAFAGAVGLSAAKSGRGGTLSLYAPIRRRRWWIVLLLPVCAAILLFTGLFVGMFFALWRARFFAAAGLLAAAWAAQRFIRAPGGESPLYFRAVNYIRVTPPRAYFVLVWISLISYSVFSKSWSPEECASVVKAPGVRYALTKRQSEEIPRLRGMFAYMAEPDEAGKTLYISFKPVSHQSFAIARLELTGSGAFRDRIQTLDLPPGGDSGMLQGIALDKARNRLYAPVSDKKSFRLLEIDCSGRGLKLVRTLPLPGEPGDIVVDQDRSLLHLAIKPARLLTYSLPGLKPLRDRQAPVMGGVDFIAADRKTGDLIITTVGFHVARENRETGRFTRKFMLTSFGIASGVGPRGLLYVASPGLDSIFELNPKTLAVINRIKTGGGPRSVAGDERRGLVYAASYSTGILHVVDTAPSPPRETASLFLGKMLRRIIVEPKSGRVYAASTCGVVEIDPVIHGKK